MGIRPSLSPARRAVVLAAGVVLGIAFIISGGSAQAAPKTSHSTQYYVDCGAGSDTAAGTSATTPWRTLAHVDTVVFQPGDSILFRRGTTCDGVLQPQGSGVAGRPNVISAYGTGARPAIVANDARAAVYLHNVQYWEIRHLDVTDANTTQDAAHAGIYVLVEDYGTGNHYVFDDVNVHDVAGCDCIQSGIDDSAGILFEAGGSTVPTGFNGIQVSHSTISNVDGFGIGVVSLWTKRALYPVGTGVWVPNRSVHIFGNRLSNLGGDGIQVENGLNSLTEYNVVNGFGLRATQSHAGVLAYNSDHPVMQFNDVSHGASSPPSFGFSVDPGNSDMVYQYNYSHDNNGPFMLFCATPGTFTDGATIRDNVSLNDHDLQLGTFEIPVVSNGCNVAQTNISFYNNTIYSPTATELIGSQVDTPIAFTDNIFVGRPTGSTIVDPVGVYSHNLYSNVSTVPAADTHAVTADPQFTRPGDSAGIAATLGYRLTCGSPAIRAGIAIADNGGRDFFGFPIPRTAPNLGAYQGPCLGG